MNRFMRQVNMDPASLADYRTDPAAFVADYAGASLPSAARLSAREREAFARRDYEYLYAAGTHPYLLWSFTEAVYVPPMPRPELVESFRQAALRHGYPDWSTTPAPAGSGSDGGDWDTTTRRDAR
jgi:hypothetical protein